MQKFFGLVSNFTEKGVTKSILVTLFCAFFLLSTEGVEAKSTSKNSKSTQVSRKKETTKASKAKKNTISTKKGKTRRAAIPINIAEEQIEPVDPEKERERKERFYSLLLGEIATQEEAYAVALDSYLDLLKKIQNPLILERAVDLALFQKKYDLVFLLTSQWVSVDDSSERARDLLAISAWLTGSPQTEKLMRQALIRSKNPELLFGRWFKDITELPTGKTGFFASDADTLLARFNLLERVIKGRDELSSIHFSMAIFAYKIKLFKDAESHALLAWRYGEHREDYAKDISGLLDQNPQMQELFWRDFLKEKPNSVGARSMLGVSLLDAKDFLEAYEVINPLPALMSKMTPAQEELWGSLPTFTVSAYLSMQNRHVQARKYLQLYAQQIGALPNSKPRLLFPQFSLLRGYVAQKQVEQAQSLFDSILKQWPDVSKQVRLEAIKIKALRSGLPAAISQVDGLLSAGEVSAKEARSLKLDAFYYMDASEKALQDIAEWRKQAYVDPEEEMAIERAYAYFLDKQLRSQEALVVLSSLMKKYPNNATVMNDLGYMLVNRSLDVKQADRWIKAAFKLEPGNPAVLDSLGWLAYRKGDRKEALSILRKSYVIFYDPEIALHLYEVLYANGLDQEAKKVLAEVKLETPHYLPRFEILNTQIETNQVTKQVLMKKGKLPKAKPSNTKKTKGRR
jgi:tetratricopeptide (TPR) repeat protein